MVISPTTISKGHIVCAHSTVHSIRTASVIQEKIDYSIFDPRSNNFTHLDVFCVIGAWLENSLIQVLGHWSAFTR